MKLDATRPVRRAGPAAAAPAVLTPLAQRVTATEAAEPGPLDALAAARRHFLRGERIEMRELAAELGIGRATLYRWVGDRDRLLGEVLWSLAEVGLAEARRRARGEGAEWVVDFVRHFLVATATHGPIRRFVEAEPEAGLRVLTSRHGVQQQRLIDVLRAELEDRSAAGTLRLRLDPATLAYAVVRVSESFIWREFITGEEPDLERAADVVRVLLS